MSSPFNKKKGGTATAPAATEASDPRTAEVANGFDGDETIKGDPFGSVSDPSGISGYKPIAFMNQLVLIHPVETGRRVTVNSGNEEDGKSPFCVVDVIPLTVPTEGGTPTKEQMVSRGDEFAVLNKDGDEEVFESYSVGERLDDLMFFNKPLVAEAAKAIRKGNQWVLGRITYGEKKPNQSRPIILRAASPEDKAIFEQWRATSR